jgi:hypothetical protein
VVETHFPEVVGGEIDVFAVKRQTGVEGNLRSPAFLPFERRKHPVQIGGIPRDDGGNGQIE